MEQPFPILIVEDNEDLAVLIRKILDAENLKADIVSTGKEAISTVIKTPNTFMLLDNSLPDTTGLDVIKTLKDKIDVVNFITLTGHGDEKLAVEMMKLGARDYLVKDKKFLDILPSAVKKVIKEINTEQKLKEAEEKLKKSESNLVKAQEITHLGHFNYDPETGLVEGSEELFNIFGLRPDSVTLNIDIFVEVMHPDDRESILAKIQRSIENNDPYDIEYRLLINDGVLKWVHAIGKTILVETGKKNLIGTVQDITERKILQQGLIQSDKLSSIGTFISGIAHELNNPLTAILGFSQKLMDSENMPEEAMDDLEVISKQSKRTARIVHELLKFSRTHKEGKANLDINNAVETILGFYSHSFKADNIELKKNLLHELPKVFADSNQLQQVFTNIIINAYYEMKKVGGQQALMVKTMKTDERVFIIFENSGLPIPNEIIGKIFDPFFTSKKVGEGTGLGLYVSYGIIKDHGGDIKVENIGNSGVRFTVSLPVSDEKVSIEVETKKTKLTVPKGIGLLFVDDEESIRGYISRVFSKEKISVHLAKDGKEAIELIEKTEYDLILSDIKMPRMNGFELCKWLHKHKPHYLERFVLATGIIDVEVEEYCHKYHCHSIIKPYSKEEILETIAELAYKYNLGNKEA